MSPDPIDLQPLTPGHFLIGGPLTRFPQTSRTPLPITSGLAARTKITPAFLEPMAEGISPSTDDSGQVALSL